MTTQLRCLLEMKIIRLRSIKRKKAISATGCSGLDGFCDHTLGAGGEEIHQHYTNLLNHAGTILYGRITYQMMEYWRPFIKNPSGDRFADEFALAIDKVPKLVFSHTLKNVDWENSVYH